MRLRKEPKNIPSMASFIKASAAIRTCTAVGLEGRCTTRTFCQKENTIDHNGKKRKGPAIWLSGPFSLPLGSDGSWGRGVDLKP